MGTNYYLHETPPCQCCGHAPEPLHIGKSSGGWCFALHVMPESEIYDLPDWIARWSRPGAVIRNEYGDVVSADEMKAIITSREVDISKGWHSMWWNGYSSEEDFHRSNGSERGPNGLLRSRIDGRDCIGHGAGTWDLITGEFS